MDITVLGIDPGSRNTGWGIVRERSGVLQLVACGVLRPPTQGAFADRLAYLFHGLQRIIQTHEPQESAIEQVFAGRNPASALKLGQARGAACVACASCGVSVRDIEPRLIKQTLVGTGSADKEQVAFMVARLLGQKAHWPLDVSDALGVAVCHLTLRRFESRIS